jgi:hypothetical protein
MVRKKTYNWGSAQDLKGLKTNNQIHNALRDRSLHGGLLSPTELQAMRAHTQDVKKGMLERMVAKGFTREHAMAQINKTVTYQTAGMRFKTMDNGELLPTGVELESFNAGMSGADIVKQVLRPAFQTSEKEHWQALSHAAFTEGLVDTLMRTFKGATREDIELLLQDVEGVDEADQTKFKLMNFLNESGVKHYSEINTVDQSDKIKKWFQTEATARYGTQSAEGKAYFGAIKNLRKRRRY